METYGRHVSYDFSVSVHEFDACIYTAHSLPETQYDPGNVLQPLRNMVSVQFPRVPYYMFRGIETAGPNLNNKWPIDLEAPLDPQCVISNIPIQTGKNIHIHTPYHHIGNLVIWAASESVEAIAILLTLQAYVMNGELSDIFLQGIRGDIVSKMFRTRVVRKAAELDYDEGVGRLDGVDILFGYTKVLGIQRANGSEDYILHLGK